MPYLLPLGWGAVLYGLGWMLGRKKPASEEKRFAEKAKDIGEEERPAPEEPLPEKGKAP